MDKRSRASLDLRHDRCPDHGARPAPELLAPAGEEDAAYAALAYGADAVYVGLGRFSARAEAVNLSPDALSQVTGYAHALQPRRRVFVALNTVILQSELKDVVTALGAAADNGVDAIIVQDLGVARIVRRFFPRIELHASTQMAIHNLAGALALAQLGFRRVTLARELTLDEIRHIAASAGIETEVFVHGALCYAYSGLCLFSSHMRGRSGNRGRCAYPCRDCYSVAAERSHGSGRKGESDGNSGFPFSMKDLALPECVAELRDAGVAGLKIEGRMKSPLYVAAVTTLYRKILDGQIGKKESRDIEDDLKTIFSRPWTRLHLRSRRAQNAVDAHWVGHRGVPVGKVAAVVSKRGRPAAIRFRTSRALERHDGLQIDLPGGGRPFGFPVDSIRLVAGSSVIEAPRGSEVLVELPKGHPEIPRDATVYCSSSQSVKRRYRFPRPKPGQFKIRRAVRVRVDVTLQGVAVHAETDLMDAAPLTVALSVPVGAPFPRAHNVEGMAAAACRAFEKMGGTSLKLAAFEFQNPDERLVPVSLLNDIRRRLAEQMEQAIARARAERDEAIRAAILPAAQAPIDECRSIPSMRWSVKVDRVAYLDALACALRDVHSILLDIGTDPLPRIMTALDCHAAALGRERFRLSLPMITRQWEERPLREKMVKLWQAGWHKWEATNPSAWSHLETAIREAGGAQSQLDLSADWSIYVLNRQTALHVLDMGATGFTLSPEDGIDNMRSLLREFGERATVVVYQDSPLFISESCAYASMKGCCAGKGKCGFLGMDLDSRSGDEIAIVNRDCRTVAIGRAPLCLVTHVRDLVGAGAINVRADFVFREYRADELRTLWEALRAGRTPARSREANFLSGLR